MHTRVFAVTYYNTDKTFTGYAIIAAPSASFALELLENHGRYADTLGYKVVVVKEIGERLGPIEILYEGIAPDGQSAYEIAVKYGYKGTEKEWVKTLQGNKGDKGDTGASAYEIAVRNGYEGSEALWAYDLLNGKGTSYLYCVKDLTELYALPKIHGYMVYVEDLNKYYTYNQDSNNEYLWLEASLGGETTASETVMNVLRALLVLVAKMRNAFLYGMNSYQGTDTAMSRVVEEYDTTIDEEPYWAISEEDLSLLLEVSIDADSGLNASPGTINDTSLEGLIIITGTSTMVANDDLLNATDPKIVIYLTTSNKNIKLLLNDGNSDSVLDLSTIASNVSTAYNMMIIVSRKMQIYGANFIWITIDDAISGTKITEGYYNYSDTLQKTIYNLSNSYSVTGITFLNLTLNKCTVYSKYQDFKTLVTPSKPSDETYKYKVAHITIRAVADDTELESVKNTIQVNELVWNQDTSELNINTENGLIVIGSSTTKKDTTGMSETQILAMLLAAGIPISKTDTGYVLGAYEAITFKNSTTGKEYEIYVDAYGNIQAEEITSDNNMIEAVSEYYDSNNNNIISVDSANRGFAARYFTQSKGDSTDNLKLNSDRVRIGSAYIPLATDKVHGCSHAFIELENTSDKDFPLKGCYLYLVYTKYINGDEMGTECIEKLALKGKIPALGTFLIRGKEYDKTANTFINVDTYDLEWYVDTTTGSYTSVGENPDYELIDLTYNSSLSNAYKLALVYYDDNMEGKSNTVPKDITADTVLVSSDVGSASYIGGFIDVMVIKGSTTENWIAGKGNAYTPLSNCITKNTFELDPANLAYRSLNTLDSNTVRWKDVKDQLYIDLSNPYIQFPNNDNKYSVTMFTPKASFENKNVCTDKTALDLDKPNMVTVSFGKNIHTTRCFNWISAGIFNEYVWIREKDTTTWENSFSSYTEVTTANTEDTTYPHRVEFSKEVNNAVYARMNGTFPANGTYYTGHKCIIKLLSTAPTLPKYYEYIVGRADINGNPDLEHCSDIMYFTIYPEENYTPIVYQITDLQGFHWIEYQAWTAAALEINKRILSDMGENNSNKVIPILINTGDMTLNGTRVNEWLDYYNAGKCLFNHLEQMNVVGNNDLCQSSDITNSDGTITKGHELLGTGDDDGKSNPYYFNLFYCYEVETSTVEIPVYANHSTTKETGDTTEATNVSVDTTPIINGVFVPSIYMFGNNTHKYLMLNSELTLRTCIDLYSLGEDSSFINIYTGYTVTDTNAFNTWGNPEWTPLYDKIYAMLYSVKDKHTIVACHEMPFTVITNANIASTEEGEAKESESYDGTNTTSRLQGLSRNHDDSSNKLGLVGSHMNLISINDLGHGTFWLSRLLEFFNITLCIGGHKHTYAVTFPIRENYLYGGDGTMSTATTSSVTAGGMNMPYSLLYDTYKSKQYTSSSDIIDLSKFPIIDVDTSTRTLASATGYFSPITNNHSDSKESSRNKVIYFMCQASGYKQASNKELPSPYLAFSKIIPNTSGGKAVKDLKYPMYAIINMDEEVKLIRLGNIMDKNNSYAFTQQNYGTGNVTTEYLKDSGTTIYGTWTTVESNI